MNEQPITEHFADDGMFPNSRLPLLIYRAAIAPERATPQGMEALFEENGWPPQWRSGIYPFHHYHSTAHEVLGIARGKAHLALGGPKGREFDVSAGDVIVIPAGVAHRRLSSSSDFLVVGGYPPGQDWDLLKGEPGERPTADGNIARVPVPETDPVGGREGALPRLWR
ncbi:MAG TPA: cupin domain-containing protein [Devosiaceae bacterium]|nr:cupin domain-containing protein [Devosiaceae bacterium]